MSHVKNVLEALKKKNEGAEDVIKDLISTNFSASEEEKGKAAEMLKGLFFSEDPKAVELIKKLDKWFSDMNAEGISEEDDDENTPIHKTFVLFQTKVNQKSTADKSGIYQYLASKLIGICDENSQLRMKARKLLLDMMKQNFKRDSI